MISDNQSICPKCGGQLKYYDHVQRLVRTKFGNKKWVAIRRLRCCKCHAVHRELPDFIFPYKQYEADIIIGVYGDFERFAADEPYVSDNTPPWFGAGEPHEDDTTPFDVR